MDRNIRIVRQLGTGLRPNHMKVEELKKNKNKKKKKKKERERERERERKKERKKE
jgi:hypothetical protein